MNNETAGKSGKKILLAEDDPDVREMLAFALRHAGHVVTLAENGKEALKLCSANSYDLIITDILMPKQDGFKVIRKLKKKQRDIPIIAISGGGVSGSLDFLEKAKRYGACCIFEKPFEPQFFVERVNEHF